MTLFKNLAFILADDHSIVRLGMQLKIMEIVKDPTIFHCSNHRDLLKLLRTTKVEYLILDINFPDGNNVTNIHDILIIQPNIKILIFSAYDEHLHGILYLKAGAHGYLSKLSSDDEIKYSLITFIEKGRYISSQLNDLLLESLLLKKRPNPFKDLSEREIEISLLLIKGHRISEIASLLNLKNSTVSTYKKRLFEKLDITSLFKLIELFDTHYNPTVL